MADSIIKSKLIENYWLEKIQSDNPSYTKVAKVENAGILQVDFREEDKRLIQFEKRFLGDDEKKLSVLFTAFGLLLHKCFSASRVLIITNDKKATYDANTFLFHEVFYKEFISLKEYTKLAYSEYLRSSGFSGIEYNELLKYITDKEVSDKVLNFGFNYESLSPISAAFENIQLVLNIGSFDEEGLQFSISYDSSCYEAYVVEELAKQYNHLLLNWESYWTKSLKEFPFEIATENNTIGESLDGDVPTLTSMFRDQAKKYSEKVAFVHDQISYTYEDLDRKSDLLATYLIREFGVGSDTLVGIYLNSSEHMILALLATLKAGGAFVPIKPGQASNHVKFVIEDTKMDVLLTESEYMFDLDYYEGQVFALDIQLESLNYPDDEINIATRDPRDLAYVIYTSGTTGTPKGVLIEDKSVVDYALWLKDTFKVSDKDSAILLSAFIFDLGYTAIWGTILLGGTLHQLSKDIALHPTLYLDEMAQREITLIKATPSLFGTLYNISSFDKLRQAASLRFVFLGGEYVSNREMLTYKRTLIDVKVINHYGPTEATVGALANEVNDELDMLRPDASVIGLQKKNTTCVLLNSDGHEMPKGFIGEVCLEGTGLARGYLNKPILTNAKFIKHPIKKDTLLYRTGDYGRRIANDKIVFEGRKDRQIKRRGYRIELDGIEAVLKSHSSVDQCALLLDDDLNKNIAQMIAFVETNTATKSIILDEYLGLQLPSYMIPDDYVFVDQMPLLLNGKVDAKKLFGNRKAKTNTKTVFVAPTNEIEKFIAAQIEEVLQLDKVGLHDNFFDIGANSISLIQINTLINVQYEAVGIVDLFNYSTVSKLAEFIKKEEDDQEIVLTEKLVILPNEYYSNEHSEDANRSDLKFYLKEDVFYKLRQILQSSELSYYDVFIALFGYVFYNISEDVQIPVFVLDIDGTIRKLPIAYADFETPDLLVKYVAEVRNKSKDENAFSLNMLDRVRFLHESPMAIAPFVFKVSEMPLQTSSLSPFNMILGIEDNEADRIGFTLSHENLNIHEHKLKELVITFNALVSSFVDA